MKSTDIAHQYFEASNKSDFRQIEALMEERTTYSSQNTGIYLGTPSIIKMQEQFHGQFSALNWNMDSVEEIKPGIIRIDYTFTGTKNDGEQIESSGVEYVVVKNDKIIHIEVRNK